MSYNEIVYPYIEGEPKNVIIDVKEIKAFLKLPAQLSQTALKTYITYLKSLTFLSQGIGKTS